MHSNVGQDFEGKAISFDRLSAEFMGHRQRLVKGPDIRPKSSEVDFKARPLHNHATFCRRNPHLI